MTTRPSRGSGVLAMLPRFADNDHVFPSHVKRGRPITYPQANWERMRKEAGCEDVTVHDLRRTVGSWLAMGGASLPLIGKVLNHKDPSTTAIYARLTDDAARGVADVRPVVDRGRQRSV